MLSGDKRTDTMKKETISSGAAFIAAMLQDPAVLEALEPVFCRIGAAIARSTAEQINTRHANALVPPKDAVIPIQDLCMMLKTTENTFRKHFIKTGKLQLVPPPANADRRKKYVSAKAWAAISKEVPMNVIRIKTAA